MARKKDIESPAGSRRVLRRVAFNRCNVKRGSPSGTAVTSKRKRLPSVGNVSTRQTVREQLFFSGIIEPSSSTQSHDDCSFRRITRSVVASCTTVLRRSPRFQVIRNVNESSVPLRAKATASLKRTARNETDHEPARKRIVQIHFSQENKTVSKELVDRRKYRNGTNCRRKKEVAGSIVSKKGSSTTRRANVRSRKIKECQVNRLPQEILSHIFGYLPSPDRKKARLVCKMWYDNCQNEKIRIRSRCKDETITDIRRYLGNCQFKRLNLSFDGVTASRLPVTLWRKIGNKLQLLECQLAAKTMRNLILFCNNLKHLYLRVSLKHQDEAFGSLTMLEKFVSNNVVKKELQTLEINVSDEVMHLSNNDNEIWRKIFEAIYRIYPNLINFAFSRYHYRNDGSIKYKCKFSRSKSTNNEIDLSLLAPVYANLAFTIFSSDDWVKSLDNLSVLRLINLELKFCKKTYLSEDGAHLRNFFANQKHLKSVRMDFSSWVGIEMLRSVLFEIVENCSELNELSYIAPFQTRHLTSAECTALIHKMAHVKNVSIGGFSISHSPLFSIASPAFKVSTLELSNVDEKICICFIRNYTRLQRLVVRKLISDDVLQCIFQHATELRILDIQLDSSCTNFGMTGRLNTFESDSNVLGYSISRLQNLERLKINLCKAVKVDDSVLLEFNFPKLRYLQCSKDFVRSKVASGMVSKLPLLEEIKFSTADMSLTHLLNFCKRTKRLYHLETNIDKFVNKFDRVFRICPRLRLITNMSTGKVHVRKIMRKNSS